MDFVRFAKTFPILSKRLLKMTESPRYFPPGGGVILFGSGSEGHWLA